MLTSAAGTAAAKIIQIDKSGGSDDGATETARAAAAPAPDAPSETSRSDTSSERSVTRKVFSGGDGYTFGELALISKKLRAATVRCANDCHLASLDRRSYAII